MLKSQNMGIDDAQTTTEDQEICPGRTGRSLIGQSETNAETETQANAETQADRHGSQRQVEQGVAEAQGQGRKDSEVNAQGQRKDTLGLDAPTTGSRLRTFIHPPTGLLIELAVEDPFEPVLLRRRDWRISACFQLITEDVVELHPFNLQGHTIYAHGDVRAAFRQAGFEPDERVIAGVTFQRETSGASGIGIVVPDHSIGYSDKLGPFSRSAPMLKVNDGFGRVPKGVKETSIGGRKVFEHANGVITDTNGRQMIQSKRQRDRVCKSSGLEDHGKD